MNPSHEEQQTGHGSAMEPGDLGLEFIETGGKIQTPAAQLAYILSGVKPGRRVRFTLRNSRSDRHLTYEIRTARGPVEVGEGRRRFVSVLTGSDNEGSYTYLGTIFDRSSDRPWKALRGHRARSTRWHYYPGTRSTIGPEAFTAKTWLWLWCHLVDSKELPSNAEVWHEGRCGRCGRTLTDPVSIARGIGPVCAGTGA